MLIATAVVAVLCTIFLKLPNWWASFSLLILIVLMMSATVSALVYGQGPTRAFGVGAAVPLSIMFLWFTGLWGRHPFLEFRDMDDIEYKILCSVLIGIVVASGFVAQGVCWWCLRGTKE